MYTPVTAHDHASNPAVPFLACGSKGPLHPAFALSLRAAARAPPPPPVFAPFAGPCEQHTNAQLRPPAHLRGCDACKQPVLCFAATLPSKVERAAARRRSQPRHPRPRTGGVLVAPYIQYTGCDYELTGSFLSLIGRTTRTRPSRNCCSASAPARQAQLDVRPQISILNSLYDVNHLKPVPRSFIALDPARRVSAHSQGPV
jgi:hypothetical protein